MTALPWRDEYTVNVAVIDAQHRRLAEFADRLHRILAEPPPNKELKHAVDELVGFTRLHFATEEELMIKYEYPDYAAHRTAHAQLLRQLDALAARIAEGGTVRAGDETDAGDDWVFNHLLEKDVPLGKFLNGKGVY